MVPERRILTFRVPTFPGSHDHMGFRSLRVELRKIEDDAAHMMLVHVVGRVRIVFYERNFDDFAPVEGRVQFIKSFIDQRIVCLYQKLRKLCIRRNDEFQHDRTPVIDQNLLSKLECFGI